MANLVVYFIQTENKWKEKYPGFTIEWTHKDLSQYCVNIYYENACILTKCSPKLDGLIDLAEYDVKRYIAAKNTIAPGGH